MKKQISVYLTLIVIGFFSGPLFPGDFNIVKVSEWGAGLYLDISIKGNYAFCAASRAGLDIMDISDPSNPRLVNNIRTSGEAVCVYVSGNSAYVADYVSSGNKSGGLKIIDITHPNIPTLVGTYDLDYASKVFVKDGYAYVLTPGHMKIFDVLRPFSPILVADIKIDPSYLDYSHKARDIFVDDNYAYVISASRILEEHPFLLAIIDVSDPTAPRLVEELTEWDFRYPTAIYVKRGYAYLTVRNGFKVIDVSDPRTPNLVGKCTTDSNNWAYGDIKIRGRYAYLASGVKGLQVVDISNPGSPTLVSSSEIGHAHGLYIKDNYAYMASHYSGLQIIDISERESLKRVGEYSSYFISGLHYKNNYVYLKKSYSGFQIVDVSNLNSPTKVGSYNNYDLVDLFISGHYAYLIGVDEEEIIFDIVDISNPSFPTLVGTYDFFASFGSIIVSGKYAYILLRKKGLHIFDISNPSFPTLVGTYESTLESNISYISMDKQVNYLYITYHKGLLVVDISNPASPVEVGHLDYHLQKKYTSTAAIHVNGRYAYVVVVDNDYPYKLILKIIDISHRSSPVMVGSIEHEGEVNVEAVYVTGNYAYVANGKYGLIIIDVSDPESPTVVKKYDTPLYVSDVKGTGDYIFVVDRSSGRLLILRSYDPGVFPFISLDRKRMSFASMAGSEGETGTQSFIIDNSGSGTLNWSLSVDQDWLSCSPSSGTGRGEVSVTVDTTGLPAGTYFGNIRVTDPTAVNSPQSAAVLLNVYNSGETSKPFGFFNTPSDGSVVSSSVPFTGWALDDIGVQSVQLFREEGDGESLVYIGDAVFVEGARPDVGQIYPWYPNNSGAGWGYMMLTNFLPNEGNGTFNIHAIATDLEGNQVTLGTKTITCDNVNAIKPFGTMDTPLQGGTASGNNYINWGWALTPQPNTIPTDGSTITVWVDGVPLGKPVYNRYREDIAALFPGYNNSSGAGGYFYLDTTPYENGVHTIQWTVTDDAGNTDGIGSRYFSIRNSSQSAGRTAQRATDISKIPVDYSQPLPVKRGYNRDVEPQIFYPDKTGQITIEIKELERVEIWLSEGTRGLAPLSNGNKLTNNHWTGFQVIGNQFRSLPIGSFLDTERGVFYWHPGAGFVGKYRFVFITGDQYENKTKKMVEITIGPKFPGG
jgi:hypothetical protein